MAIRVHIEHTFSTGSSSVTCVNTILLNSLFRLAEHAVLLNQLIRTRIRLCHPMCDSLSRTLDNLSLAVKHTNRSLITTQNERI